MVSQSVAVPLFSGRLLQFVVTVDASNSAYPPDVAAAVEAFLSLGDADRIAATVRVCAYHSKILAQAEHRGMIDLLSIEPRKLDDPHEIWSFVTPTSVAVDRRDDYDRDVYITVACECTWEREHGLQLVYQGGTRLVRVSAQDGHLADADAYALPEG